jgi:SAM-dependent methyltransferase
MPGSVIDEMIPPLCKTFLSYWRDLIYRRGDARYCPICQNTSRRFTSYGAVSRSDARCPWCSSLERHRCEWFYLVRRTDLFDGRAKRVLHIAPEPCLEVSLRRRFGLNYVTTDLHDEHAMIRMDITNIPFLKNSFDVLLCSHVLIYVPDDLRALSEFYRILKPGGWAILLEHIQPGTTFEDPSIIDPLDRLREYGLYDYIRRYGPDFIDRVRGAGFVVRKATPTEFIYSTEFSLCGMTKSVDDIYHCIKPRIAA